MMYPLSTVPSGSGVLLYCTSMARLCSGKHLYFSYPKSHISDLQPD